MGWYKKRGGGGFLSGQAGLLVSLTFDSKEFGEYSKLSAELSILPDGASEPVSQFLDAGFLYADGSISDDGTTLEGSASVQEGEFQAFVQSVLDAGGGITEEDIADGKNFAALTGWRYEFGRAINVERQMASGRKKLGCKKDGNVGKGGKTYTDEEIMQAGKRQDKTDKTKFYNQDYLVVSKVLGKGEAVAAAPAAKAAGKVAASKAPKADDATEAADNLLMELLADAKKPLKKSGLSSLVVRKALSSDMEDGTRDAIRKLYQDDEYLDRENGWTFDTSGKEKLVALAAVN